MKKIIQFIPIYLIVIGILLATALIGNRAITTMAEQTPHTARTCVIIDAGHGGVDGGATSCTGVLESKINLEIALILNDLMHLLGIDTKMIRTDDRSVYTQGESIAAKKVSDLKERLRIVNNTEHAILISIHQNFFPDSRYSGAQVFYAGTHGSAELADFMQQSMVRTLNPGSNRTIKKGHSIYLLEKAACPAVLIECGFLSNPEEEAKLRCPEYQKKLCCVIAATTCQYLSNT